MDKMTRESLINQLNAEREFRRKQALNPPQVSVKDIFNKFSFKDVYVESNELPLATIMKLVTEFLSNPSVINYSGDVEK